MMKLSSITIKGMHKVKDKTYDLSGFRYFHGENGAGKSTVMQAIQLALLGYIPGTDKNKSAVFKHSNSPEMFVKLIIDDNGNPITIMRKWYKKGASIIAGFSIEPSIYSVEGIIGGLELPVFNFSEFIGMTANKLKDWFINFLPAADSKLDWKSILNDSIADFGKILDPEFINGVISHITDKAQQDHGVKLVRDFNTYLKEQQSYYKAELSRLQNTVQSLIYYSECDNSQSVDSLKSDIQAMQLNIDNMNTKLLKIQQNHKLAESMKSIKSVVTAPSLNEDSAYNSSKKSVEAAEKELAVLEERKMMLEKQISEANIEYKEKKRVAESSGKCPYTCENCASITALISVYNTEMEKLQEKIHSLTLQVTELDDKITALKSEINSKLADMQKIEKAYAQYELISKQMNTDVTDITEDEITAEIVSLKSKIKQHNDTIIKLEANKRYEELTDRLTNDKYKTEQNIEILKVWIKLTDVNGLQSQLMEAPFKKLADKMTVYLQKFFSGTEKFSTAKFHLSEKANSFSFGVLDKSNEYIEFDLLSSGEKCLYTLALLISIVDESDSPLKLVMIDDLLDHLDTVRIKDCFETLYNIDSIQILLVGVQQCTHPKAEEFVIEVG
ncbi:MAG: AAA family ATPase [Clostridium sp.]|nr:AAA family ATPase [Clostridium sp.]